MGINVVLFSHNKLQFQKYTLWEMLIIILNKLSSSWLDRYIIQFLSMRTKSIIHIDNLRFNYSFMQQSCIMCNVVTTIIAVLLLDGCETS